MSNTVRNGLLAAVIAAAFTVVILALLGTSASSTVLQALIYALIAFVGTVAVDTVMARRRGRAPR